jgi:sugar O-acyltransferase (sialic acid O-acetyltransferase NeuD family)
MNEIYGVFGAGGYGREVMPLARTQLTNQGKNTGNIFFVVDSPEVDEVNDTKVISLTDFLKIKAKQKKLVCAIAESKVRSALKERIANAGVQDWSIMAANCVVMDQVKIGLGSILSPFVTVTSNVTIGQSFHANLYSYVGHDCMIADYVTFAPAVKCNGNVIIESHAYVGTGAIIRPGLRGKPLRIGEGAVIGMGAVVTKDVPAGVTVFGNPARAIKRPE